MSDVLTIQIENREAVDAAFSELAEHSLDMRRLAPALSNAWYARVRGWLDSSGQGTFARLSEAYAKEKEKKYGSAPVLTASGAMKESLTSRDAPDSFYLETADELTLGATGKSGEIASYHQGGTARMPARSPFDSLLIEEFKNEDVGPILVADLTEYARSLSLSVV